MYNVRYHIASLAGVFLALALGLVLGGLVVQRGTVDQQQGNLVAGLRKEFGILRTENRELTTENLALAGFSEDMSREWVADRLVGKNIVVISGSGRTDGVDAATEAIQSAGGSVISVTLLQPDLGLRAAKARAEVTSETVYSDDLLSSVVTSLAAEWVDPSTEHPVTEGLSDAGAILVEGFEPGMEMVGLVDVAVRNGKPDTTALALAMEFERQDAVAVAGESPAVDSGLALAAWNRKVAAFDTLGSPVGRYTLVALLRGAKSGYYGSGEGVTAAYPPLAEDE